MTKKEIIWREILFQAIENKKIEFTQKELAQKYGFSLSTVFNALKIPRSVSAIEGKRGLKIAPIIILIKYPNATIFLIKNNNISTIRLNPKLKTDRSIPCNKYEDINTPIIPAITGTKKYPNKNSIIFNIKPSFI